MQWFGCEGIWWVQVLVSIQGLVLVPEPYYNEAGYEKQVRLLPFAITQS